MTVKVKVAPDGLRELLISGDEPWRDELLEKYRNEQCDGLVLSSFGKELVEDIDFVRQLPDIRGLRLLGNIRDDSAAFDLPSLRRLELGSVSRASLDLSRLSHLVDLHTAARPGIEGLRGLSELERLFIWDWAARDFMVLGNKPRLKFLRIQMKRGTRCASAGLARAPNLEWLWLYDGRLSDWNDLCGLNSLTEIVLESTKLEAIDFVSEMPRLRTLRLENVGELASIAPLRGHTSLEIVTLNGSTRVRDGDLYPLFEIENLRAVGMDRSAPHYSHKPAEIRARFPGK